MLYFSLLAGIAGANAYIWPSPKLDALEAMRWDQDDTINGVASFVQPCSFYIFGNDDGTPTGRANGPDWIRTAYHDMATHNSDDGTGGLDASIRFPEEQARPENAGNGFFNTLAVFMSFTSRHISMADMIAIGAITAIENCGGPQIAFRGGRVDSAEPNVAGVPEPQQDLQAHIDAFARQGFTQTEMISLIACGHTFGGVEHKPFPDIVPDLKDPQNTLSVAHFDTTFADFDNNVATEYMAGTTTNPLVVGANDTTNSDKRIFASDGNATMASFAKSLDLFTSTCADLFARMLDTVPSDVELTDVIDPLPVKPAEVKLLLDGDTLKISGLVRIFNVTKDAVPVVSMQWEDRTSGANNVSLAADHSTGFGGGRFQSLFYAFNHTGDANDGLDVGFLALAPAVGITSMSFTVDGKLEDQGGVGFAVEDRVVFALSSCLTSADPPKGRFDIAVRNDANPTRVFLELDVKDAVNRTSVKETDLVRPEQAISVGAGSYSLWSIDLADSNKYTIGAEIDGDRFSSIDVHSLGDLTLCAPKRRGFQHQRRPREF
ncbi:heme peroxidase [Mycena filopes]|nr:heme peroxidase [Mycena filopes]